MKLLVTGCQRSGTLYVATILAKAGVDVTHERRLPSEWGQAHPRHKRPVDGPPAEADVEVSWLAAAWLPYRCPVVQLVRDPRRVVASQLSRRWFAKGTRHARWVLGRMPHLADEPSDLLRCARYWHDWNLQIEQHAGLRVRVETFDPAVLPLDADADLLAEAWRSTPTDTHTSAPTVTVGWGDLPADVCAMAARYGYEVPDATFVHDR